MCVQNEVQKKAHLPSVCLKMGKPTIMNETFYNRPKRNQKRRREKRDSLFPTDRSAVRGCQSAEKTIPKLKMWTVLPAIHSMKAIMRRFFTGAEAASQAFCRKTDVKDIKF